MPLETARIWIAEGDYERALKALSGPAPAGATEAEVRERAMLRTQARRHLMQSRVADAWVSGPTEPVTLGQSVPISLVIANIGSTNLSIASEQAGSRTAVRIEARCTEFRSDGSRVSHDRSTLFELPQDLVLAAGKRHAWEITWDSGEIAPECACVRVYTVHATLHTSALNAEGEDHLAALQFRPGRFVVLPQGWEPLRNEPLRQLSRVLALNAADHLPVLMVLMNPTDRESAKTSLRQSLAGGTLGPAMTAATLTALDLCATLDGAVTVSRAGSGSSRAP